MHSLLAGLWCMQTSLVDYHVTVLTSDLRGAGTDGEVYLTLKGTKGGVGGRPPVRCTHTIQCLLIGISLADSPCLACIVCHHTWRVRIPFGTHHASGYAVVPV
jgi:hypothetical protein